MAKLMNYATGKKEELNQEQERRFGTDPEFVKQYIPQDRDSQGRFKKHLEAGHPPHTAAMLTISDHLSETPKEDLTQSREAVMDLVRRHTKPGANGGTFGAPKARGRATVTHNVSLPTKEEAKKAEAEEPTEKK